MQATSRYAWASLISVLALIGAATVGLWLGNVLRRLSDNADRREYERECNDRAGQGAAHPVDLETWLKDRERRKG